MGSPTLCWIARKYSSTTAFAGKSLDTGGVDAPCSESVGKASVWTPMRADAATELFYHEGATAASSGRGLCVTLRIHT
jgi:hypothetical protein